MMSRPGFRNAPLLRNLDSAWELGEPKGSYELIYLRSVSYLRSREPSCKAHHPTNLKSINIPYKSVGLFTAMGARHVAIIVSPE